MKDPIATQGTRQVELEDPTLQRLQQELLPRLPWGLLRYGFPQ
jgi:hypothetical protein